MSISLIFQEPEQHTGGDKSGTKSSGANYCSGMFGGGLNIHKLFGVNLQPFSWKHLMKFADFFCYFLAFPAGQTSRVAAAASSWFAGSDGARGANVDPGGQRL